MTPLAPTLLAQAMPSGNSPDAVDAYYDTLFARYIERIPTEPWQIQWTGPPLVALTWAVGLITWLWVFARFFDQVHRDSLALHGPVSFGGAVLERNGRVATFSYVTWTIVTLWAAYYAIAHAIAGQVY